VDADSSAAFGKLNLDSGNVFRFNFGSGQKSETNEENVNLSEDGTSNSEPEKNENPSVCEKKKSFQFNPSDNSFRFNFSTE